MSNVLKSDRILICEESRYVFNIKRNTVTYPSSINQSDKDYKLEVVAEEIKRKAEQEASQIIISAEEQAGELIHDAEQKAQDILEKAYEQGYKEGYEEGHDQGYKKGLEEGRARGEEQYKDAIRKANLVREEYEKMRNMLYQSCEQDMVNLAIDIARKIIDTRMEEDENTYLRIAEKALAEIKGQKSVRLRCSSHDYPIAIANKEHLISRLDGLTDINIIEDIFLTKGSCIIDTEGGGVDVSVDIQIEKIKNAFKSIILESANKGAHQ